MKKIYIEEKEKLFYKWLVSHRYQIALVALLALLFLNLHRLPYFNLFFNKDISILILVVVGVLTFKIRVHNIFKTGVVVLIFAFVFGVIQKTGTAELLANCTFSVFVVGTIKGILEIEDNNFMVSENEEK